MKRQLFLFTLLFLLISCTEEFLEKNDPSVQDHLIGRITELIDNLDNLETSSARKDSLVKAYNLIIENANDSIKSRLLSKISYNLYKEHTDSVFLAINHQSQKIAREKQDSISLANLYWDIGNYYAKGILKDSAFFYYSQAQKLFKNLDRSFLESRMLINKAIVQSSIKDYVGSEINSIKALELLNQANEEKPFQLYRCYNNLGIIYNELGEYQKSISYHEKALNIIEGTDNNNNFEENTKNNIGIVRQNQGFYPQAIAIFKGLLQDNNLRHRNIKLYAMILDNLTYNQFKGKIINKKIEHNFQLAKHIRDSIKDYNGLAISNIHLSEYFKEQGNSVEAYKYALDARDISKKIEDYKNLLRSLKILSEIRAVTRFKYLNEYSKIADSLNRVERAQRNKFIRIAYETEQFKYRNQQLRKQKIYLIGLLVMFAVSVGLVFVIKNNRSKYKILQSERERQQANEEVYALMLSLQSKLQEVRQQEKNRISSELHDGILGKIFGLRLSLDGLNNKKDDYSIGVRARYIDEIRKIEEEIRDLSHELFNDSKIKETDFGDLIQELIERKSKLGKFKFHVHIANDIPWHYLGNDLKINIYRLIQEALQNVIKHANAKNVYINFENKKNDLILTISDDGKGFNTAKNAQGIGINSMRNRVSKMNGILSIQSKEKEGTSIIITIPSVN
ncbi:ATP-binding protein [Galbibacter sp. PAP.153]|uniref:tetratricopeptide repeat-containing sensor histidine kinase n=1 Tax=Galbibacter sp. PAP.153 TaxID=3104623 RepID=UPI00300A1984